MNKILLIVAKWQLGQSFQYWAPHFPHFKFFFKELPDFNLLDRDQFGMILDQPRAYIYICTHVYLYLYIYI